MKAFDLVLRKFPALARALGIGLGATLVCLAVVRFYFHDSRPKVYLLGDSCIGNYRLDPGDRLQDQLGRALGGRFGVRNWAEPGARPADFYLQLARGRLFAGKPEQVVVAIAPDKFIPGGGSGRFDEDGANLRWLPWSETGVKFWQRLGERERRVALVQQAGIVLYGAADLARLSWIRHVQWPWERHRMRVAGADRRRKVKEHFRRKGIDEASMPLLAQADFDTLSRARDFHIMLSLVREEGIAPTVVLLPCANPDLSAEVLPPKVLASRDSVDRMMRRWLEREGVGYIDFNEPGRIQRFPDRFWDDGDHLRDPAAFAILAESIRTELESQPRLSSRSRQ